MSDGLPMKLLLRVATTRPRNNYRPEDITKTPTQVQAKDSSILGEIVTQCGPNVRT